ncbi:HAD family hydrolase [Desulfonema magnum]|uniref:Haloacid dehalogenase-like family protein n=1 Tax=Desulfonema magnum TaxID=45655 RepID=A0A975GLE2_9BACT|nr:HAD family hydrolase [Desulfonema magnum]QTA84733.1 Haloacid dehalogenase-like family protein [Desulfonema magnum]
MHIFLDIGFTLMGGPAFSPPKMIRKILNLGEDDSAVLYDIIFCENHHTPDSLMVSLEKRLGCRISRDQQKDIAAFWQRQFLDVYELEGASVFIKNLARSGAYLHIISNLWFPFYNKFRTVFQNDLNNIRTKTLSFEEGIRKPCAEIYRRALDRAKALPEESVMVGDSVGNDILPCAELGMKCVWFKSRPVEKHQLESKRLLLSKYDDIFEVNSLRAAQSVIERFLK